MTFVLGITGVGDEPVTPDRYRTLREKFSIAIEEAHEPGSQFTPINKGAIQWDAANPADTRKFGEFLTAELLRYPVELIERAGLKKLVLCSTLTNSGKRIWGCSTTGIIWLDVSDRARTGQKLLLHHELFHVLDLRSHNQGIWPASSWDDWEAISGAAVYANNWKDWRDGKPNLVTNQDGPGFISRYARTSILEDRAEVFAYCLILPYRVARKAGTDTALQAKINLMKTTLARVIPNLKPEFWARSDPADQEFDR